MVNLLGSQVVAAAAVGREAQGAKMGQKGKLVERAQLKGPKVGEKVEQASNGRVRFETVEQSGNKDNVSEMGEKIDCDLVEEARQLLLKEFQEFNSSSNTNSKDSNSKGRISRVHLEQLMDKARPQTCWRYLRENNLQVGNSVKQMKRNLFWREQNYVDTVKAGDFVKEFWLKAPIGITGTTRDGQPILWVTGKNYRKPNGNEAKPFIKRFAIHSIFSWDKENQHNFNKLVLVFDVTATTFRNLDLEFSSWLVTLRDALPYRIQAIYIIGIPYLMRPIIRLIISWLPENYRQECHCCQLSDLTEGEQAVFGLDQVPVEAGGRADDKWRLAPSQVPWANQPKVSDKFNGKLLAEIDSAICFNTSAERLEQLYQMQRNFDQQQASRH